jgi:hypothetical protein
MSTAWKRRGYKQIPIGLPRKSVTSDSWSALRDKESRKQAALGYDASLVNRGEELAYKAGDYYLIASVTHHDGLRLYLSSLLKWFRPEERALTIEEYIIVLQRLCEYLTFNGSSLILVDEPKPVSVSGFSVVGHIVTRTKGWKYVERRNAIILESMD